MLCLPGSPALSDFRLEKLQQKIRQQGSEVSDVSATFLHLIDVDENYEKWFNKLLFKDN